MSMMTANGWWGFVGPNCDGGDVSARLRSAGTEFSAAAVKRMKTAATAMPFSVRGGLTDDSFLSTIDDRSGAVVSHLLPSMPMRIDHEARALVCSVGDLVYENTYRRIPNRAN